MGQVLITVWKYPNTKLSHSLRQSDEDIIWLHLPPIFHCQHVHRNRSRRNVSFKSLVRTFDSGKWNRSIRCDWETSLRIKVSRVVNLAVPYHDLGWCMVTIQQLFGWGVHRNTEMQLMLLHCQEKVNPVGWKRWSGTEHFCVSLHNLRLWFLAREFLSRRYLRAWNCWYRWLCTNKLFTLGHLSKSFKSEIRNTRMKFKPSGGQVWMTYNHITIGWTFIFDYVLEL